MTELCALHFSIKGCCMILLRESCAALATTLTPSIRKEVYLASTTLEREQQLQHLQAHVGRKHMACALFMCLLTASLPHTALLVLRAGSEHAAHLSSQQVFGSFLKGPAAAHHAAYAARRHCHTAFVPCCCLPLVFGGERSSSSLSLLGYQQTSAQKGACKKALNEGCFWSIKAQSQLVLSDVGRHS